MSREGEVTDILDSSDPYCTHGLFLLPRVKWHVTTELLNCEIYCSRRRSGGFTSARTLHSPLTKRAGHKGRAVTFSILPPVVKSLLRRRGQKRGFRKRSSLNLHSQFHKSILVSLFPLSDIMSHTNVGIRVTASFYNLPAFLALVITPDELTLSVLLLLALWPLSFLRLRSP